MLEDLNITQGVEKWVNELQKAGVYILLYVNNVINATGAWGNSAETGFSTKPSFVFVVTGLVMFFMTLFFYPFYLTVLGPNHRVLGTRSSVCKSSSNLEKCLYLIHTTLIYGSFYLYSSPLVPEQCVV